MIEGPDGSGEQVMPLEMLSFQRSLGRAAPPADEMPLADESPDAATVRRAAQPAEAYGVDDAEEHILSDEGSEETLTSRAEQPADDDEVARQEAADEKGTGEEGEGECSVQAFSKTTSLYDDWLHRGPYLYELDLQNYIRFIQREERPTADG